MSRSNPTSNTPHPCTRWFEWNGSEGHPKYYDKATEKTIDLKSDMTFILLDQLSTVKGWHDASDSGIFSNEVRDTTAEPFVVKAFKGGTLAQGIYQNIRDRILAEGAKFVTNLYIAYKSGDGLALGSIQFSGAALMAWSDFAKEHRADLYKKAIRIKGFKEGKKGKITFRVPVFHIAELSEEMDKQAVEIDKVLQEYLKGYFAKTRPQQAEHETEREHGESHHEQDEPQFEPPTDEPDDSGVPF